MEFTQIFVHSIYIIWNFSKNFLCFRDKNTLRIVLYLPKEESVTVILFK